MDLVSAALSQNLRRSSLQLCLLPLQLLLGQLVGLEALHPPVHLGQTVFSFDQQHMIWMQHWLIFLEECFMSFDTTLIRFLLVVVKFLSLFLYGSCHIGNLAARKHFATFGAAPI